MVYRAWASLVLPADLGGELPVPVFVATGESGRRVHTIGRISHIASALTLVPRIITQ